MNVADLMHRPAARRREVLRGPTAELLVIDTLVAEGTEIEIEAELAAVSDGILATGTAMARWTSACRRCLNPVVGRSHAGFVEHYSEHPLEGETYPLVHDTIDLELVAREAILLDLPLAPLCREECAGLCLTCGADRNVGHCSCQTPVSDPRWAALDALRVDAD